MGFSIGEIHAQINTADTDVEIDQTRLDHIRLLHKTYPPIQLPFSFNRLTPLPITPFDANYGIDKLVFGDEAPCSIIGIIPDTSEYFGFFYLKASDSELPSFISYDKKGKLINNVLLFEACWQGCYSDCQAELEIDVDLTIQLQFVEFNYDCQYGEFEPEFDGYFPIIASEIKGFRNYFKIEVNGEVILLKSETLNNEELGEQAIIQRNRRRSMNDKN